MASKTFRLFKNLPSVLLGMMLAADLGATTSIYNISDTPTQADHDAIKSDWTAVGFDIRTAVSQYEDNI